MSKILIIDDCSDICEILKTFFEKTNHKVFVSNEENDALEKIRDCNPDIIILDLVMNDIGGMEVLKQVREFNKEVGIIMISGLTNESICTDALENGADMYITKPIDFYHLTTNILPHLIKTKELERKTAENE